jgi:hypothetical protein
MPNKAIKDPIWQWAGVGLDPVTLLLGGVRKGVSALECRTGGWVGRSAIGQKKKWNPL